MPPALRASISGYLKAYATVGAARAGVAGNVDFYIAHRLHRARGGHTQELIYVPWYADAVAGSGLSE